ncbi:MAG: DUF5606 domain-containing protein [Bacteroidota bacterium]
MDLSKVMTVSGKGGLYSLVAQNKGGIIVESLVDGHRMQVFASQRVSSLEEISIFTTGEDLPLKDAMKKMFDTLKGEPCIDPNSDAPKVKEFISGLIPEIDHERVYNSDLKKLLTWYNLLNEHKMLVFDEETTEEKTEEVTEEKKEE